MPNAARVDGWCGDGYYGLGQKRCRPFCAPSLKGTRGHMEALLRRLYDHIVSAFVQLADHPHSGDRDAEWQERMCTAVQEMTDDTRKCAAMTSANVRAIGTMPARSAKREWDGALCSACFWVHDPLAPKDGSSRLPGRNGGAGP